MATVCFRPEQGGFPHHCETPMSMDRVAHRFWCNRPERYMPGSSEALPAVHPQAVRQEVASKSLEGRCHLKFRCRPMAIFGPARSFRRGIAPRRLAYIGTVALLPPPPAVGNTLQLAVG